jgi:molybdate transport system substrate-binding protein
MRRAVVAIAVVATLVIAAPTGGAATAKKSSGVRGSVTVLAASSLTDAFTAIGKGFERKYPGTHVTLSFSSTATLVTQIQQGAPADVFASADAANMQKLVDGGQVAKGGFSVFARNRLEIAVAPGNPKKIKTLADTLKSGVTLVLCAPEVPCGKYALQAYANAGLAPPLVPTGANVKDTLSKVTLGEADAAIVYVTDVKAAKGQVQGVKIRSSVNVVASYPIAPIVGATNPVAAKAFVRFVADRPGSGQRTLRRFGFLAP